MSHHYYTRGNNMHMLSAEDAIQASKELHAYTACKCVDCCRVMKGLVELTATQD